MKEKENETESAMRDRLAALKLIAEELNINVHIAAKPDSIPAAAKEQGPLTDEEVLAKQKEDLIRFEVKLQKDSMLQYSLSGNYVGLLGDEIVAQSPSLEFAKLCAKAFLKERGEVERFREVLVVPVCVPDQDAEMYMSTVYMNLKINKNT